MTFRGSADFERCDQKLSGAKIILELCGDSAFLWQCEGKCSSFEWKPKKGNQLPMINVLSILDVYKTTNNGPVNFLSWIPGEPSRNANEYCVRVVGAESGMVDTYCKKRYKSVCVQRQSEFRGFPAKPKCYLCSQKHIMRGLRSK